MATRARRAVASAAGALAVGALSAAGGCGEGEALAPAGPAAPAAAPVDPEAVLREEAATRLELCWRAAGTLRALEADLPADLGDALDSGSGPGAAPGPAQVAAGRAGAARKLLKAAEGRPMMAGSHPELAAALNTAVASLAASAREYETLGAALHRRGVSLAERSRAAGRFRRGEGVDALKSAIPAAFIARVEGRYEVDPEGVVWRCRDGQWLEAATERSRGTCEAEGAAAAAPARAGE